MTKSLTYVKFNLIYFYTSSCQFKAQQQSSHLCCISSTCSPWSCELVLGPQQSTWPGFRTPSHASQAWDLGRVWGLEFVQSRGLSKWKDQGLLSPLASALLTFHWLDLSHLLLPTTRETESQKAHSPGVALPIDQPSLTLLRTFWNPCSPEQRGILLSLKISNSPRGDGEIAQW